jgi:formylmethanofuran dehydrogenase subunit E
MPFTNYESAENMQAITSRMCSRCTEYFPINYNEYNRNEEQVCPACQEEEDNALKLELNH